ncbi:hypothetical protein E2C01_082046 [Portunus trituberculatus]|uniref:Uncharacterized protein n=1 Tax=Portunus trituberculatus TaxID=210409 RepID=A0A5B7INY1_PORTR|nr:hypothetical protein [Portunus trituberculatus]
MKDPFRSPSLSNASRALLSFVSNKSPPSDSSCLDEPLNDEDPLENLPLDDPEKDSKELLEPLELDPRDR